MPDLRKENSETFEGNALYPIFGYSGKINSELSETNFPNESSECLTESDEEGPKRIKRSTSRFYFKTFCEAEKESL
ncbi:hypothetical protein CEXT_97181 [Caerostris extrusa]|uniref:Uncharacterized protein n=1 Tax=Caerostris extrusa TaxID=172846 RepID=A0AAV4NH00_CAEEX|nr:hypothetical protein CEXT_97181 [Caerostris extrusa]